MRRLLLGLASALVLVTGCGGSDEPSSAGSGSPSGGGSSPGGGASSSPLSDPAARRYVEAVNREDLDGLVSAFAPDGVVVDVSRTIRGHDAIRGWADAEVIGGRLDVLRTNPYQRGIQMIVRWAPEGSSGWEACYTFDTTGDQITRADLQYSCR